MKLITLEEHYFFLPEGTPPPPAKMSLTQGSLVDAPLFDDSERMFTMGEKRIRDMDEWGVTMQVVSAPMPPNVEAEAMAAACRSLNDVLASNISKNPDRFAGFATLPMIVPDVCADELEHAVNSLGFVGAIVHGRSSGCSLADPSYEELLLKCEELEVPIYLHPSLPPQPVSDAYYTEGLTPDVAAVLSKYGYGWHVDVGTELLTCILRGMFDRHPKLQIILGHWGELLPQYIDRFDDTMPAALIGLEHDPSYYLKNNVYYTPSGIYTPALLELTKSLVGIDRIMFSMDYPLCTPEGRDKILESPLLSEEEREKLWHKNVEQLLKLSR